MSSCLFSVSGRRRLTSSYSVGCNFSSTSWACLYDPLKANCVTYSIWRKCSLWSSLFLEMAYISGDGGGRRGVDAQEGAGDMAHSVFAGVARPLESICLADNALRDARTAQRHYTCCVLTQKA